jgi:hypothetical protein
MSPADGDTQGDCQSLSVTKLQPLWVMTSMQTYAQACNRLREADPTSQSFATMERNRVFFCFAMEVSSTSCCVVGYHGNAINKSLHSNGRLLNHSCGRFPHYVVLFIPASMTFPASAKKNEEPRELSRIRD